MVDVAAFRPPRNGGGSVTVAAHSVRECRGARARRRGPRPYLGYPVTPTTLAHMLARAVDVIDFSTTEKRRRECDRGRAQCARVSGSDGATAQVVWRPLVSRRIGVAWRKCTVGQHMGGGSTRDVATRTGAQLSSDWGQHVQARRALRSRFSGSRISRPVGAAWRKCTVMCGVRATGRTGDANQRAASSNSGQVSQSSMVD